MSELVGWTNLAIRPAGRELDNAFVHGRHDELRGRMVGKPTRIAEMMRLRLSDTAASAVLAEQHRMQAMACQQMALITLSPFRDVWLDLAAKWTKLAQEQEAEAKPH